ncbi:uncharacterized protein PAC_16926 [Phialocephala subalpina]|uniref:SMP-30/Gluconolactonase/LRE-like region domain-containing protein n=1 Tax=Phialocephala subalpina TaxID=576137 RepID=A0A1L7XQ15_9HELO|nr:uncharacterized protein PAC_16926 [Phialocephala subalpina]
MPSTSAFWGILALLILNSVHLVASTQLTKRSTNLNSRSTLPLTVNTIYEGEVSTWYENLAVRSNGQLLVTRLDSSLLELLDPTSSSPPVLVHNFTSIYAGCLGITETSKDVFYVVAQAPFDGNFVKTSGSSSIFKVDLTASGDNVTANALVTKVTDIPEADFLNGMTTLNAAAGLVLVADSYNGWVYRLDVNTGNYSVVIDDPKMKYLPGSLTNLGINGIKIRDGYLYWTNTGSPDFSRIQINSLGEPLGNSTVVATVHNADDFVFAEDGVAWVAQNQIESLSVVENGTTTLVAGNPNSTVLAGVTAGEFGRVGGTEKILYFTTNGGLAVPVNGSVIVGGKIAYIDTSTFDE